MNTTYKPDGYNSLSPYFVVDGAQKLIDQLKEIFEYEELRKYERTDGSGKIMHAEIRIDDTVVMMGDSMGNYAQAPLMMHVYVNDVEDTYQKALQAGCKPLQKPVQRKGEDDKRGAFLDLFGNSWYISTKMN